MNKNGSISFTLLIHFCTQGDIYFAETSEVSKTSEVCKLST